MAIPTFYNSSDAGAPVVYKNDPEFFSKILDACLVTGYGSKTAAGWSTPYTGTVGTTNTVALNNQRSALNMPSSAEYNIGTADYTLEFWSYLLSNKNYNVMFEMRPTTNNAFQLAGDSAGNIIFYENTAYRITGTAAITLSTWQHIAVTRASNLTKIFVNGTQVGATYTATTNMTSCRPCVGNDYANSSSYFFNGYMDDVHLVIGTALYTASFTPPTTELAAISGTKLLLNFNGAHNGVTMLDSSTVGATITNPSNLWILTNAIAPPIGALNPTTTMHHTYSNAAGKTLYIKGISSTYAQVNAYNSMTSLTSGTQAFVPPEIPTAASNWCRHEAAVAVADVTNAHEWKVIATNNSFYLLLKGNNISSNTADSVYFNRGLTDPINDGWTWYGFGKVGDAKMSAGDTFLPITSQTVYNGNMFSPLAAYISHPKAPATTGGPIVFNPTGLLRYLTTGILTKINPYRAIGYIDYQQSSLWEYAPAGTTTLKIKSDKHLSALSKIPLVAFGPIGADLKGIHIGSLPGVYIFKSAEALNMSTGDEITITTLSGDTMLLMAIRPFNAYNIAGPQDTTGLFFINKGDWT